MEQGFGSPGVGDWGWGSPSPGFPFVVPDTGWGSPSQPLTLVSAGVLLLPDEGGEVLRLRAVGLWPVEGPWSVRLEAEGQTLHCLGMVPGQGTQEARRCFTTPDLAHLRACSPRAGVGTWSLRVVGPSGEEAYAADAVVVVRRTRHPATFRLRRMFPASVYDAAGQRE